MHSAAAVLGSTISKIVKDGDHPNTLVKLYNFAQQGDVTFSFFYIHMYVSSAVILNINILVFDQVNYPMVNIL